MPTPRINLLADGERIEGRILDQLTRLEVRESDEDATIAALRFRLVQEPTGKYSPLDDQLFGAGVSLSVEVASPGGLVQRLFEGFVTHVRPHFETIEANCYLEVLAMDAAVLLDAEDRAATYPDSTDSDAAETILQRYQITAQVESTPALHKTDYQMLVQRTTDWRFLRKLARRNGYCCYFEYDPDQDEVIGYFRPRALDAAAQADLTIQRDGTNLTWIDLQLAMTGPVRHLGAAIDPIRKRIVRSGGEADEDALGEDGLDSDIEGGLTQGGASAAQAWLRDPFPLDSAIEAEGTAASNDDRLAIEARGEIDCELYRGLLRPRRPALIKGVGELLTGTYYIKTVRTTLNEGALTQTFIAYRNALAQSGQEEFGQEAEEVPAQ